MSIELLTDCLPTTEKSQKLLTELLTRQDVEDETAAIVKRHYYIIRPILEEEK
jgi:chemotaxis regulatin CheY-phosphate phosphatase CheZ